MRALPDSVVENARPQSSLGLFGSGMINKIPQLAPDVVQLHWLGGGLVRPPALSRLKGYPVVWRLADMWPFAGTEHVTQTSRYRSAYDPSTRPPSEKGLDVERWAWRRKQRAIQQIRDLTIVAPSRWMANTARASVLFGARPIEIIATGIDVEMYRPRPRTAVRARLGFAKTTKVVASGAVSSVENPLKGWTELVRAMQLVRQRNNAVHLLVFGNDLDYKARDFPFPITFLGYIADEAEMVDIYNAADVFVAPSHMENLANTVIESLACGTPVVAFDIGGMPDAIEHSVSGYLASALDPSDLAKGIEAIIDGGVRYRFAARDRAVSLFDERVQTRRYLSLYEQLLSDPRDLGVTPGL